MKTTLDFSPIAPDEVVDLSIDFTSYLAPGDSVSSVSTWNCTVAPGSQEPDPDPAGRLSGSPTLSGATVTQKVQTCIQGVTYVMEAVIITQGGETLSLWSNITCQGVGSA